MSLDSEEDPTFVYGVGNYAPLVKSELWVPTLVSGSLEPERRRSRVRAPHDELPPFGDGVRQRGPASSLLSKRSSRSDPGARQV